ncbi:MAG: hypothetical protein NTX03_06505 [Bacteroidetes bacterium]|nr:hypothetical protein [Bacteroidota bacterium]
MKKNTVYFLFAAILLASCSHKSMRVNNCPYPFKGGTGTSTTTNIKVENQNTTAAPKIEIGGECLASEKAPKALANTKDIAITTFKKVNNFISPIKPKKLASYKASTNKVMRKLYKKYSPAKFNIFSSIWLVLSLISFGLVIVHLLALLLFYLLGVLGVALGINTQIGLYSLLSFLPYYFLLGLGFFTVPVFIFFGFLFLAIFIGVLIYNASKKKDPTKTEPDPIQKDKPEEKK